MGDLLLERVGAALVEIGREKQTALVRIGSPGGQRMAFFEDGALVFFVSDHERDGLIDFLWADGRLAGEPRPDASERTRQTLVASLLESGVVDADRLRPWLVTYAIESMGRMFGERDGTVKAMPGMRAQHPVTLGIPATELTLEAVRLIGDVSLVREAIGPLSDCAVPADDHMDRLLSYPLNFQEGMVGSQITVPIALSEVLAVSGLPEPDALKALLAIRLVGILDPFQPPKELTDTGRLRRRKEALATGVAVDTEAAAALLGVERPKAAAADVEPGPVSMDELVRAMASPEPAEAAGPMGMEAVRPPRGRRGNTGQLKLMASAYVQMARDEAKAKNFNAAVEYYEQALSQNPEDLEVTMELARLLMSKPQTRGAAERVAARACETFRYSASPRVVLAELYRDSGRHAQAAQVIADAERLEPNSADVRAYHGTKGKGGMFSRLRL